MGRLAGFSGREIGRVAESRGWTFQRQRASHRMYKMPGSRWTLSVPEHRSVDEGLVRDIVRKMDMTVDEFLSEARK